MASRLVRKCCIVKLRCSRLCGCRRGGSVESYLGGRNGRLPRCCESCVLNWLVRTTRSHEIQRAFCCRCKCTVLATWTNRRVLRTAIERERAILCVWHCHVTCTQKRRPETTRHRMNIFLRRGPRWQHWEQVCIGPTIDQMRSDIVIFGHCWRSRGKQMRQGIWRVAD